MELLGYKYLLKEYCKNRIKMLYTQGYDINCDEMIRQVEEMPFSYDKIHEFAEGLYGLPVRKDFKFCEPDSLDEIKKERPANRTDEIIPSRPELQLQDVILQDKVAGGVFGRIAACMLGKPFEMNWQKSDIESYLKQANAYPLNNYVPFYSPYSWVATDTAPSCREFIKFAQADDDITYFAIGIGILEEYGENFSTQDVAKYWLSNIPFLKTWGPEHTMYQKLASWCSYHDQELPTGEEWDRLCAFLNDGEELIGAMIRGDAFGLCYPGKVEKAASLAYKDGMVSHRKTGLYAEMWVAGCVAAAFYYNNPVEVINAGLSQIPENSRFATEMRKALEISVSAKTWEDAYLEINERWGYLRHAGTFNETAAIINALVHSVDETGKVDYEKAICITVMHGWDTDCSAATCGCIAGVMAGLHEIPKKWTKPLNDTYYTFKASEFNHSITEFANRAYNLARINNV